MTLQDTFSARHNYASAKEITLREAAPEGMRYVVVETAHQLGWSASDLRSLLCLVLRVKPDRGNWSDGNIWDEVCHLIDKCDWFRVYDVIETLYAKMEERGYLHGGQTASQFAATINRVFIEDGIGWQLIDGKISTRGDDGFEAIVQGAQAQLAASNRPTAAKHIKDALECLSRRPDANSSGAAYHAIGSLECVARDITGDSKATLGEILKRYPGLLPKPLDTALSQVWGYASNEVRHVKEGQDIGRDEAELLVGLAASVATYLSRKPNL